MCAYFSIIYAEKNVSSQRKIVKHLISFTCFQCLWSFMHIFLSANHFSYNSNSLLLFVDVSVNGIVCHRHRPFIVWLDAVYLFQYVWDFAFFYFVVKMVFVGEEACFFPRSRYSSLLSQHYFCSCTLYLHCDFYVCIYFIILRFVYDLCIKNMHLQCRIDHSFVVLLFTE